MPRTVRVLELRSVRGTGGGPEKTILLGAERHDRTRYTVTVCYVRDLRDDVFGIDERAKRMHVDYVEVRERHSFDLSILGHLTTLVKERGIDIVHGHDHKTDALAWFLARRTGAIPLSTAHGWTGQSWRERFIYYPAHKRLLSLFPRVIAVSTDVKDELVRHGARPERVTVLLNGIDPERFKRLQERQEPIRQALGFGPRDCVIGAVGRLERQKRFDLLLEAFAGIVESGRPSGRPNTLRLVIVGDGSLRQSLVAQAASLGLGTSCQFLGHRDDVADLHHAFDLFVQSSEYEGTPNAVLEAMAMGTPVVATDAGGTSELIATGIHGLVVPCGDVPALEGAIRAALADPDAARARAAAARARVETDLSFEARTRRLEHIYDELAESRRPNRAAQTEPSRVPHA